VVFYHFLRGADSGFAPDTRFHLLATYGVLGVAFFFILSGYILVYNYAGTQERAQRLNPRSFWWKRFARIYPLYLFALLICVPITVMNGVQLHGAIGAAARMPVTFLANLFLVHAWYWHLNGEWNGPGWSLSAEAFFYLLFPFLTRKLASIRDGGWKQAAALSAGLLALGVVVLALVDWGLVQVDLHDNWRLAGYLRYFLLYNPLVNSTVFIMGMTLCLGEQRIRREAPRASWWLNVVCGVIVLAGLADLAFNIPFPAVPRTAAAGIFFSALILLGGSGGPAWLTRLLSWSPLLLLGEASYAVYLLHYPVFTYFTWIWNSTGLKHYDPAAQSNVPFYITYLAVLIGVSILSFKFLEQPARKLIQGRQPWTWRPVEKRTPPLESAQVAAAAQPE